MNGGVSMFSTGALVAWAAARARAWAAGSRRAPDARPAAPCCTFPDAVSMSEDSERSRFSRAVRTSCPRWYWGSAKRPKVVSVSSTWRSWLRRAISARTGAEAVNDSARPAPA
jgi:hypothetical protein